jgi:hypothetical protein
MAAQSQFPELRSLFDKNREVVKMLKAEKMLTEKQIYFSAVYSRLGKKMSESKDKTSLTALTAVINGRYQVCQPDSITITWYNYDTDEKLFEHTFSINRPLQAPGRDGADTDDPSSVFRGLGELEVNNLVEKRLTEIRLKEEYDRIKEDNHKMQSRIRELEESKTGLEQDIAAKETMENYLKIIGMALPGISKIFGGVGILNMLAGVEDNPPEISVAQKPKDERGEMIRMLSEYMEEELTQQEVATLYMLFMEIQKDKTQIQKILTQITTNGHETTAQKPAA